MNRTSVAGVLALAGTALALVIPMPASARVQITPKAVAWQVKDLANKNLKFAGDPTRVVSSTCVSRGSGTYVCRATFSTGEHYYWPSVTVKNGYLKLSGGMAI